MTKEEAKQAMAEGKKVTHTTFLPYEYITLDKSCNKILDEEGYSLNSEIFWGYRTHENFKIGWSIWSPKF